ncbi:MAG TPA: MFS transporter [Devosia sp.]|nr:MFS transporter [Devosia sp.]
MSNMIKIQALFLSSALLMFGGGPQRLLLAVRGADEGFSIFSLGLIGTGWSLGFISGSVAVPLLVRRTGHIRAFSVMAAVGTLTILLNLLWISETGWIVLRVFSGFCFAGAAMIVESWLNEVSEPGNRGTIFSVYVMLNMSFSTLGQLSMSITGVAGYLPFVIGAMAFILSLLPTAVTTRRQPRPLASARIDLKALYSASPVAVVACFSVGVGNGSFGTLAPVFGFLQGLSTSDIAHMMSTAYILGAIGQVPFGRLSDSIDRRWVIIGTSLFAAFVGLFIALFNPTGGMWMLILVGLYGFGAYPIHAVAIAHANDGADPGDFASVAAGLLLVFGLGLAAGPLMASLAMNWLRPSALFLVTAFFHGLLAISAFVRMQVRPAREDDEHVPFRAVPLGKNSTLATVALDPRATESSSDKMGETGVTPGISAKPVQEDTEEEMA